MYHFVRKEEPIEYCFFLFQKQLLAIRLAKPTCPCATYCTRWIAISTLNILKFPLGRGQGIGLATS